MADNPRIEELRRRVHKDPASIAFAQLAEEHRRAGDYEEAARVCRAGLERHPTYLSARVTLGRALIELQQYDDAQAELDQVLRSAPENLAALRGLAEIHQRRGNLKEALRQYESALRIAKHDHELEESVQELARQLSQETERAPAADPLSSIDVLDARQWPSLDDATTAEPNTIPLEALSPELEAAADEFTKALQALDALTLDLPTPALPSIDAGPTEAANEPSIEEVLVAPPAPEPEPAAPIAAVPEAEPGETPEPEPLRHIDPVSEEREPAPEAAHASSEDDAIVNELESWLDAIVRDRTEREGTTDQSDLRVNFRS